MTETRVHTLPPPAPEAAAHSARLMDVIRAEIEAGSGSIGFARFMALALYAPGLGYYSAGTRKFGADGDFVTAPELSPLFARSLARQCREILQRVARGDILELGAGSGVMAADLLAEMEAQGALPEHYFILEISAELRQRQRMLLERRLPHLMPRIRWLDTLPAQAMQGVVIANEVLDAMPVHRFQIARGAVRELRVACRGDSFAWCDAPAGGALQSAVTALQKELGRDLPQGYASEINLGLAPWLAGVAAPLERGALLLIDYGYPRREYYHPQRASGTLMCHYRQRAHPDPLVLAGLQDITAYVDFTAVAEAGTSAGLELGGYTTQAHFLLACGVLELAAAAGPGPGREYLELARQVKQLTLPGEMGERFKVMALKRGIPGPLQGFTLQDQRGRL